MSRCRSRLRDPWRPVRVLPEWVLRRRGPTAPLTRRSWAFDVGLALGLGLIAILGRRQTDVPGRGAARPPGALPSASGAARPGPEPAVTGPWAGVDRARAAARAHRGTAGLPAAVPAVDAVGRAGHGHDGREHHDALRLSFYVCVIAAYSAAVVQPVPGPGAGEPAGAGLPVPASCRRRDQAGTGGAITRCRRARCRS